MAIDSNDPSSTAVEPAIENELPTYRAISPMAVFSLILGLIALFCFADFYFLVAAAAAVVTGFLADRKIRRMPDVLTGRGFAQAGIAMGLIFGLGSVTTDYVQDYIRRTEAARFARTYVKVLQDRSLGENLWYRIPPAARKNMTPAQVMERFENSKMEPMKAEEQLGPIRAIKDRLAKDPKGDLDFIRIEQVVVDGLDFLAAALVKVDAAGGPGTDGDDYALIVFKGTPGRPYEWVIDSVMHPYKPGKYVPPAKSAPDDGHGHPH